MAKDYYSTLGVPRNATAEEIKKSFRKLARETHPDANQEDPTAEARFRELAEAYEVLSDSGRRAAYDRGDTIDLGDLLGGFDDLIRSVFGDTGWFGRPTTTSTKARDLLVPAEVTLAEAGFGTTTTVSFRSRVTCGKCGGDGAAPGAIRNTCATCGGGGVVRVARRGLLGTMMSVVPCDTCSGQGFLISERCRECNGVGTQLGERSVKVEIPPGVDNGTRLRLNGQGEAGGAGTLAGDLFVEIRLLPDARFQRDGSDLLYEVSIGMAVAALGSEIQVPLLEGDSEGLKIPAGTQPGWLTRLRGLGVPHLGRRGRGDLIVRINVQVPTELSEQQEEILRFFAELSGEQPAEQVETRSRRRRH